MSIDPLPIIVEIGRRATTPGNTIGGDTRFLAVGLTREVVGPAADGGPELIAVCPTQETAELVKRALTNYVLQCGSNQ